MDKPASGSRTKRVNSRARDDVRQIIDRAAEETLLDQTLVRVDAESYQHYLAILDQPPGGPKFERLMSAPKPWQAY